VVLPMVPFRFFQLESPTASGSWATIRQQPQAARLPLVALGSRPATCTSVPELVAPGLWQGSAG
jgi:hypothetical protein